MDEAIEQLAHEPLKDLTNEKLRQKFTNQFEMVNTAIRFAREAIISKRPAKIKIDTQNIAYLIVQELAVEPLDQDYAARDIS